MSLDEIMVASEEGRHAAVGRFVLEIFRVVEGKANGKIHV